MIILFLLIMEHPATAVIDSLSYYYGLNQPDSLFMTAECSLSPDEDIKIYYSKQFGLQVKSDGAMGEIVKGIVLLTGIGICDFWKTLGEMDTIISKGDLLTLVPKEKGLFSEAELKLDRQQWLVTSARVKISTGGDSAESKGDTVFAKISYGTSRSGGDNNRLPVEITVKGSSDFTIKHKYGKTKSCSFPIESVVTFNNDLPDIEIKYKAR